MSDRLGLLATEVVARRPTREALTQAIVEIESLPGAPIVAGPALAILNRALMRASR